MYTTNYQQPSYYAHYHCPPSNHYSFIQWRSVDAVKGAPFWGKRTLNSVIHPECAMHIAHCATMQCEICKVPGVRILGHRCHMYTYMGPTQEMGGYCM